MCGIAGTVSTGEVDALITRRMCRVIEHRGPDGAGFHDEPRAALGQDHAERIWALLQFEQWHRRFLDDVPCEVADLPGQQHRVAAPPGALPGTGTTR